MVINVKTDTNSYDVVIENGAIDKITQYIPPKCKVMIVTDSGVPSEYCDSVTLHYAKTVRYIIPNGEDNKNLHNVEEILAVMLENGFDRSDCVVAVGGGVVGDLAGLVASLYMRGIAFCNIPTTLLSALDSSVGGKTAVNFSGIKNAIGTFYQPSAVLFDLMTLNTLSQRQIVNGLCEGVKTAALFDSEMFTLFEKGEEFSHLSDVVYKSVYYKKKIVEQDTREKGVRRLLNFGHTLGHGIEIASDEKLLHGEAVALGMYLISCGEVAERLKKVFEALQIWDRISSEYNKLLSEKKDIIAHAIRHDKKSDGEICHIAVVNKIGNGEIDDMKIDDVLSHLVKIQ